MIVDWASCARPLTRERVERWTAPHKSMVKHPRYGSVIVPHASKLAAIVNAAEFWRCDPGELTRDAEVLWVPQDAGPVARPREFCRPKTNNIDKEEQQ